MVFRKNIILARIFPISSYHCAFFRWSISQAQKFIVNHGLYSRSSIINFMHCIQIFKNRKIMTAVSKILQRKKFWCYFWCVYNFPTQRHNLCTTCINTSPKCEQTLFESFININIAHLYIIIILHKFHFNSFFSWGESGRSLINLSFLACLEDLGRHL